MHALSLPTWIVHVCSVVEWIAAIWFVWRYGEVTRDPSWYWLALGMLPALVSAMCAITWHLFDNSPSWEWLVTLQALTTLIGNITLCVGGWKIWQTRKGA
ncbi:MAG: DUF2499 domain-containing protein [Geminocystis sp.]|nr:DUF2499 domain-containing protein [Geminocystis sp.]HIK38020.1 DUF2499 domain-containing protein [Geminocystis sp. M7585_C2015_104]MCS7147205.1 DUF2499 domain-containing protein [Geminocystis sp.]MCX8078570.1 DUF2499 domain-containing protein [Geminocystis sp.]MDW8116201.1 DUF2499 domain-containing protein [Geminocystis sp.]